MNETEFYRNHVKKKLLLWGDHSRVENTTESGTPDISYAIKGIQGWIETKIIRKGEMKFETFQLAWRRKRARHSDYKNLWTLALDGNTVLLYNTRTLLDSQRTMYKDWIVVDVYSLKESASSPLMRDEWRDIYDAILRGQ